MTPKPIGVGIRMGALDLANYHVSRCMTSRNNVLVLSLYFNFKLWQPRELTPKPNNFGLRPTFNLEWFWKLK